MKKVFVFILILIGLTGCDKNNIQSHNFFYMDTYINVKIYDNKNADEIFKEIDNIYKKYHELSDRYNGYDGIDNVYFINNNNLEIKEVKLDLELCNIIKLGLSYKEKTNNLFDINMAKVIDVWKHYRELGEGIPTKEELNLALNNTNPIEFINECTINNNNPSLDLGAIAKGYATEKVGEYLRNQGIHKFLINAGGNVMVGDHYDDATYKIGLETPDANKNIYKTIKGNNISVVTSGGYERFYEYKGVKYHHIINPQTLMPESKYKSVTVITEDSGIADILSTSLFLLSIDEGKELIKDMNVEIVWYIDENNIVTTEGITKYE